MYIPSVMYEYLHSLSLTYLVLSEFCTLVNLFFSALNTEELSTDGAATVENSVDGPQKIKHRSTL